VSTTSAKEKKEMDSDAIAEATMNGETIEETTQKEVTLPENPYNVLQEIMKHPADPELGFGENAYEIPKETATVLFKDKVSKQSLLNASKKKLVEMNIIETKRNGTMSDNAIVTVLKPDVKLRTGGQGRRVGGPSKPSTTTARRPGRPRNDATAPKVASAAKTGRPAGRPKSTVKTNGTITIDLIREKLAQNPERIEKYLALMGKVLDTYGDLFEGQFQVK
jgi:hypothetical protein